jgi:succinate dehydrogenase hydrophobic membrane anchor protein
MTRHMAHGRESGRRDWLLERGTALLLLLLVPWLGLHLAFLPGLSQAHLADWLHAPINAMALSSLILMAALHASLGLRSILMDYIATPSLRALSLLITRSLLVFSAVIGLGAIWLLHTGATP